MIVSVADGVRLYPLEMPNLANYLLALPAAGRDLQRCKGGHQAQAAQYRATHRLFLQAVRNLRDSPNRSSIFGRHRNKK